MRFAKWSTILLLSAAMWAQTAPTSRSATAQPTTTKKTTTKKVTKAAAPKKAAPASAEIEALRRAVADQQQAIEAQKQAMAAQQAQIQQLRQDLQSRNQAVDQAQQTAQQAQATSAAVQSKLAGVDKLQSDVNDVKLNVTNAANSVQEEQKRVSALEGIVSHFRFTGDMRVRQEDFFQTTSTCTTCTPRVRERIRARLGIEGKAGEDFVGGIALATGTIFDPTSTNETLTSNFERKNFTLDRGYITYAPKAHPWIQLTGGKFAATWFKTNQTFDPDLNPEGFSEKLSFDVKGPMVKNVTFTGLQLLFNEVSAPTASSNAACIAGQEFCANGLNTRGADSYAVGGQASVKLQPVKRVTITPYYTILNWRNQNALLNDPSTVTGSTALMIPTSGAQTPISTNFGPNGLTNATVTIGTAADGAVIRNYASKFLYSDLILDTTINTGTRWPVRLTLEYLDNLNAVAHPFVCANSSCSTTVVATKLGRQAHVYKAEATFGQLKKPGDLQFTYGWWRQEQDSVLAAFDESDQRAPTNIIQNLFTAQYVLRSNLTLGYSLWIGRTLNTALQNAVRLSTIVPGAQEPYLKRMQFDAVYKF